MSKKDRELQQQNPSHRSDSGKQQKQQQRPDASSGKMKSSQSGMQQQGSNQAKGGFADWEHKNHLDE